MIQSVEHTIQTYRMISAHDTVLCGLSGGADSVGLLLCLHELDIPVCACHLNHGLRGEQSDGDEAFCRELCREMDIPFLSAQVDAAAEAQRRQLSLETAARALRYAFFEECAGQFHAGKIATAHTADDNLETMLFRLIRGTGTAGLAGIPPVRGKIIRPLLYVERREIEQYLNGRGQSWRTDETNEQDGCTRNRIRHHVIPALKEIAPDAATHAVQAAQLLRQDDEALDAQAQALQSADLSQWRGLPPAIRSRIIRRRLLGAGVPAGELGSVHTAAVEQLCERKRGSVSLPGGYVAQIRRGRLAVTKQRENFGQCVSLQIGQQAEWGHYRICLTADPDRVSGWKYTMVLSKKEIEKNRLSIRRWGSGDRLTLPGARGARTLKRLYADRGIAPVQRDELPVLCTDSGEVVAAAGIGAEERFSCCTDGEKYIWAVTEKERNKI